MRRRHSVNLVLHFIQGCSSQWIHFHGCTPQKVKNRNRKRARGGPLAQVAASVRSMWDRAGAGPRGAQNRSRVVQTDGVALQAAVQVCRMIKCDREVARKKLHVIKSAVDQECSV